MVGCCEVEEVHGLGIGVGKRHVLVGCCRAFQDGRSARVMCGCRGEGVGQWAGASLLVLQGAVLRNHPRWSVFSARGV